VKEDIRHILSQRERNVINDPRFYPAGVLVLLYEKEGEYYVVFTKRTSNVEHHKGEISFPGGAFDNEDKTIEFTALRETYEEVGVKVQDVEILGKLDDMVTRSNFAVTPLVGTIPYPYSFKINEIEVAELLEVPLSHLLDKKNLIQETRAFNGVTHVMQSYQFKEHVIFGATAMMLRQFLDLVFPGL